MYRSGGAQSTDGWARSRDFGAMQGTGPAPPGLHAGKLAVGSGGDGEDALCEAGAVGVGIGGPAGVVGAATPVGHGCTLSGGLLPPGSRSEMSFRGTEAALLGSVRSSQYTVPGTIRWSTRGSRPMLRTAVARRSACVRSLKSPREMRRPPASGGIASASSMLPRSSSADPRRCALLARATKSKLRSPMAV